MCRYTIAYLLANCWLTKSESGLGNEIGAPPSHTDGIWGTAHRAWIIDVSGEPVSLARSNLI